MTQIYTDLLDGDFLPQISQIYADSFGRGFSPADLRRFFWTGISLANYADLLLRVAFEKYSEM